MKAKYHNFKRQQSTFLTKTSWCGYYIEQWQIPAHTRMHADLKHDKTIHPYHCFTQTYPIPHHHNPPHTHFTPYTLFVCFTCPLVRLSLSLMCWVTILSISSLSMGYWASCEHRKWQVSSLKNKHRSQHMHTLSHVNVQDSVNKF